MMPQAKTIRQVLVCENHSKPGMGVVAELRKFAREHHFEIVTAASTEAARQLLQTQRIAIAVIDVGRESGEAQALLRSIGHGFPSLPLFVFNGFMLPGIEEKAKEYDQVQYCEDPGGLAALLPLILENRVTKKKGMIMGIQLSNFLDWLDSEKLSGQVVVRSGARQGVLFLKDGRLVGAEMKDSPSATALAEMSAWEKVTVEIKEGAPAIQNKAPAERKAGLVRGDSGSRIETLRLSRRGKILSIRIQALQLAVAAIREMLPDSLLRTDIFLAADGRSLAGWNSQPLACSAFAAITRSLVDSLAASGFPPLGSYYLLELSAGEMVLIVVSGELLAGILLARDRVHMGLLINIILPKVEKALKDSHAIEFTA